QSASPAEIIKGAVGHQRLSIVDDYVTSRDRLKTLLVYSSLSKLGTEREIHGEAIVDPDIDDNYIPAVDIAVPESGNITGRLFVNGEQYLTIGSGNLEIVPQALTHVDDLKLE